METVLKANDHKAGFQYMSGRDMLQRIMEESGEVQRSIWLANHEKTPSGYREDHLRAIVKEVVDVANFAAALRDRLEHEV